MFTWKPQALRTAQFDKLKITNNLLYAVARKRFLAKNQIDLVGLFVFGKFQLATHVHHSHGRGKYKCDESTFIATTFEGDRWIHNPSNRKLAISLGFLSDLTS